MPRAACDAEDASPSEIRPSASGYCELLASRSEEDILEELGLDYVEPETAIFRLSWAARGENAEDVIGAVEVSGSNMGIRRRSRLRRANSLNSLAGGDSYTYAAASKA